MSTLNVCDTRCVDMFEPLLIEIGIQIKGKTTLPCSQIIYLYFPTCAKRMTEYNHVPIVDKYRQKVKALSISFRSC